MGVRINRYSIMFFVNHMRAIRWFKWGNEPVHIRF